MKVKEKRLIADFTEDELKELIRDALQLTSREREFRQELPQDLKLYTIDEAALILRTTTPSVRERLYNGDIKGIKAGGKWLFTQQQLREFIERIASGEIDARTYRNTANQDNTAKS